VQSFCKADSVIIICGDFNINYLVNNEKKTRLNAILQSYNLTSLVDFPTRTHLRSSTAIDNIFMDT
jgi:hypothetical protein